MKERASKMWTGGFLRMTLDFSNCPWLEFAAAEAQAGVREDTRPGQSNPRVDEYLRTVGLSDDDTPWCSAVLGLVCRVPVRTTGLSQRAAQRSTAQLVMEAWKRFQDAVARNDKRAIARMTHFPFKHPSLLVAEKGTLTRDGFMTAFDKVFSEGIRRQVAKGTPVKVTAADIKEARDDGAEPCGRLGDWVVQVRPDEKIDSSKDDEAFFRLVFRVVQGKVVFSR